jgi:hypothetical protein
MDACVCRLLLRRSICDLLKNRMWRLEMDGEGDNGGESDDAGEK